MTLNPPNRLPKLPAEHRLALDRVDTIRTALKQGDPSAALFSAVAHEFSERLEPHFRVEEGSLSSTFSIEIAPELRNRVVEEHQRLRALVQALNERNVDALRAYADLLEAHVSLEERELYPAISACLRR